MNICEELIPIILNDCSEHIIIFDDTGRIIAANDKAKQETGFHDEIDRENITNIYPLITYKKEEKVAFKENFILNSNMETSCYCKNQTCFPVSILIKNYESCIPMVYVAYAFNIKTQKLLARQQQTAMQELEEANKLKNEFMANVTHELRTPVNGMKGLATNLLDTSLDSEQKDNIEIIIRCCENMTKIINDLLDFSKMESGKLNLEKREFNFKKFLNDILAIHTPKINEKGLKLIVNIGNNIPDYIIGDELRLGQIINNLFSNAIKFTQKGHIAFEVINSMQTDTEVELFFMVIDTGIGIAKGDVDKLFKSFSQIDGSSTRRFGGIGLGLSITKQLVEMMGGVIHVEGEKDKGSTFSFSVKFGIGKNNITEKDNNTIKSECDTERNINSLNISLQMPEREEDDDISQDSFEKIEELLEKLAICVDMDGWSKAESFAATIKNLMPADNQELKRCAFRLEMNVRKEDHDKTIQQIEVLSKLLKEVKK